MRRAIHSLCYCYFLYPLRHHCHWHYHYYYHKTSVVVSLFDDGVDVVDIVFDHCFCE